MFNVAYPLHSHVSFKRVKTLSIIFDRKNVIIICSSMLMPKRENIPKVLNEPCHEKTGLLPMCKHSRRTAVW